MPLKNTSLQKLNKMKIKKEESFVDSTQQEEIDESFWYEIFKC